MAKLLKEMGVKALFPTITALSEAGADETFAEWVKQPENAQALMDWYWSRTELDITTANDAQDLVRVPDLPTLRLIEIVEKHLALTHLDVAFIQQDFLRDERGKTYEAKVWMPHGAVRPMPHVRDMFAKSGFEGNTAAFMIWLMKHKRIGTFATIPEHSRLFRDGGVLSAPEAFRNQDNRILSLSKAVYAEWKSGVTYVGFREVKTPWVNP